MENMISKIEKRIEKLQRLIADEQGLIARKSSAPISKTSVRGIIMASEEILSYYERISELESIVYEMKKKVLSERRKLKTKKEKENKMFWIAEIGINGSQHHKKEFCATKKIAEQRVDELRNDLENLHPAAVPQPSKVYRAKKGRDYFETICAGEVILSRRQNDCNAINVIEKN